MSKEEDIVAFVKSNKNESKFPAKKTNASCSFIYKVSLKKTWGGRKEFLLVKMSIPQGKKMFAGNIFEILTPRKVFGSWRKFSRIVLHQSQVENHFFLTIAEHMT